VHDMLRYQKFTIGWAWQDEYGYVDNKDDFQTMLAYSPLHVGATAKALPPMLILTGDHDDRVFPAHSFKLAATLQHQLSTAENPVLLRVDIKAGHGAGKPTAKAIQETADAHAFLLQHLRE
jgi:prolyl oligopeptidase